MPDERAGEWPTADGGLRRLCCRSHPVPRFRCRLCGRCFSRQKKPHINAICVDLMVACVGAFQLDELESFESNRFQPVTVPALIERRTLFIVATAVGPLRRKGCMTAHQRRQRAEQRIDRSRPVRAALPLEHLFGLGSTRPRQSAVSNQPYQRPAAALCGPPSPPHLVRVETAGKIAGSPEDRGAVVELLQRDYPANEDDACPGAGDHAAGLPAGGDPCLARGLGFSESGPAELTEVFRPARSSGIL